MKPVTLGKKEQRLRLSAQARQTYDRHKAASGGRPRAIREDRLVAILVEHGLPEPEALDQFIDKLIAGYREGVGDPGDHDRLLFDPKLTDLASLPPGLLDHKELPLPDAFIPRTYDDVHTLCERMIVLSRDPALIAYVVAGWPDSRVSRTEVRLGDRAAIDDAMRLLERHVRALLRLNGVRPEMYEAIVTGRHGSALRLLDKRGVPPTFTVLEVTRLIACHGLLWCAHDLQLIMARARVAAINPLGALLDSSKVEVKPETIANPLRRYLTLLRLAMDIYATQAEEHDPLAPKSLIEDIPEDSERTLRSLAGSITHSLGPMIVALVDDRTALDRLMADLRARKFHGHPEVLRILEQPVSANELSAHFSGIWFSGLSHVQVAGVAALRYLQAERWIERLIAEWRPYPAKHWIFLRDGPAMPPFDPCEFATGWQGEARYLLQLYRRETRQDKMAPEPGEWIDPHANAGNEVIKVARRYLAAQPQRSIEDCVGDHESVRRTFYLIDLIPEERLAR